MFCFRQFIDISTSTYTYFLWDKCTMEGIVIDPVFNQLDRDQSFINELDINLKYVLDTHVHADHITSAVSMREKFGASIVLGANSGVEPDLLLGDGDNITFGQYEVRAILTPGHTSGCTSYLCNNYVFTGDTLFIRGCGRTDFQEGSNRELFNSVREKLFKLPDETIVYPGHDYNGKTSSTIEEEKRFNPRLKLENTFSDFENIMNNLKLAYPKNIKESLPANKKLGK